MYQRYSETTQMSFSQKKPETMRIENRGQNNGNPHMNGLFPVKSAFNCCSLLFIYPVKKRTLMINQLLTKKKIKRIFETNTSTYSSYCDVDKLYSRLDEKFLYLLMRHKRYSWWTNCEFKTTYLSFLTQVARAQRFRSQWHSYTPSCQSPTQVTLRYAAREPGRGYFSST